MTVTGRRLLPRTAAGAGPVLVAAAAATASKCWVGMIVGILEILIGFWAAPMTTAGRPQNFTEQAS